MSLEGLQGIAGVASSIASVGRSVASLGRSVAPIIQGATGAAGSVYAGIEAQRTAEYNARVAKLESGMALQAAVQSEQNAAITRTAAAIEAARHVALGRQVQGEQAVAAARSGLVVTEGSPLLAQIETIRMSHEDAVLARWKGDVQATGLMAEAAQERVRATVLQSRAALLRAQGRRTLLGGLLGAGTAAAKGLGRYEELSRIQVPTATTDEPFWPTGQPAGWQAYRAGEWAA